jgi:hypothetical protein
MKIIAQFLFILGLHACSVKKETNHLESDIKTDTLKSDKTVPAWVINIWQNHFNEADINILTAMYDEWFNIKTEDDLAKFYFKSIETGNKIALNLQTKVEQLSDDKFYHAIDAFVHENNTTQPWLCGLSPSCFAECTSPGFRKNFALLYDKAKSTIGTNDDKYFKLMLETYGEEGHVSTLYSNYFRGMWDYGGGSLLGSGQHAKILKTLEAIQKQTNIFNTEIVTIREAIMIDIKEHTAYMNTPEKIITEIEDIIQSVKLTNDEKYELEKRKSEFLNNDNKIQTDCEHKNCDYGG